MQIDKLSAPGLSLGELIGFQCNVRADKINGGNYDRVYYVDNQYTYNANGELELVATVEGEYSSMVSGKYTYLISTCPVNAKLMSDIFEMNSHNTPEKDRNPFGSLFQ